MICMKKKIKKKTVRKKKIRKMIKKSMKKKVAKKKTVKKPIPNVVKVKIDGKAMSQSEVIVAAAEITESEILDNSYNAALNALSKRTMMNNSRRVDVLSGSRVPVVVTDRFALIDRDRGTLVFLPESNQEFLDDILICHKICEKVSLPALIDIGVDVSENVSVPSKQSIEKFLLNYNERKDNLVTITDDKTAETVLDITKAMGNARKDIAKISEKWMKKFHRNVNMIETVGLEDAKVVLVVYGQNSRSVKKAIMDLASSEQEKPIKVGLIRVHIARPFPKDELKLALELIPKKAKIGVIDNVTSLGMAGIMYTEISSLLTRPVSSFVAQELLSTRNIVDIVSQLLSQDTPDTLWVD